jgi:hypothetical protein
MGFIEKGSVAVKLNANSLMNIAYLTQITNIRISDKNPLVYLRDYDVDGFDKVLDTHLIPMQILEWSRQETMPDDALSIFIEERIHLLIEGLKRKLHSMPFDMIDSI